MTLLLLPDFIAISLLVFVLFRVRGKHQDGVIGMWTVGLLLILLEGAARIVYEVPTGPLVHMLAHALALNAYGAAGAVFVLSASYRLRRLPYGTRFLWINVLPHLLLFTAYSFNLTSQALYWCVAGLGLLIGVASPLMLRQTSPLYYAFALIWTPLLLCVHHSDYRNATYVSLFFLYGLAALFFRQSLPAASTGRIAVVAGFSMWAVCFLTHPWIASYHVEWLNFASQLWNMQKFVITVGLLLVLLEEQVRSNEWLALHDGLTALPNRRLFEDRLQHALLNAQRAGSRLAVFLLDLDGFKEVNDTLGHDAGDMVLKGVSENLQQSLRRSDTLARLGGDEFTLLAADLDGTAGRGPMNQEADRAGADAIESDSCAAAGLPQVLRLLSTMNAAVKLPISLGQGYGDRTISVSACIGVAIYPDEGHTMEALLRLADQRMYAGKRRSKDATAEPGAYTDLDLQRA